MNTVLNQKEKKNKTCVSDANRIHLRCAWSLFITVTTFLFCFLNSDRGGGGLYALLEKCFDKSFAMFKMFNACELINDCLKQKGRVYIITNHHISKQYEQYIVVFRITLVEMLVILSENQKDFTIV